MAGVQQVGHRVCSGHEGFSDGLVAELIMAMRASVNVYCVLAYRVRCSRRACVVRGEGGGLVGCVHGGVHAVSGGLVLGECGKVSEVSEILPQYVLLEWLLVG